MPQLSETQRSIEAICQMEEKELAKRSRAERFGDIVATQAGRMWFIVIHAIWFAVWVSLNEGLVPALKGFDPFPFSLLTMIVSLEAIFLSLFILMSQNRASRREDARAHLDLQINLLAERENTLMLQMLQALCADRNLEIARHPELKLLTRPIDPKRVAEDLAANLPNGEASSNAL
jgi:uncharacterized membrane protein